MADRPLKIALGLFVVLLGYALTNGVVWLRFQEHTVEATTNGNVERASALQQELEAIEAGGQPSSPFADPRSPRVLGGPSGSHTAVLAPGPLTALAIGQSDLLPYYHDVNIYTNESSFHQNGEVENPLNLMVGRFDLAFAVVYLLPLLILALSFNVLSEEREQGTLALTLSQPVAARSVATLKLAFRALVVAGIVLGVSLLGALVLQIGELTRDEVARQGAKRKEEQRDNQPERGDDQENALEEISLHRCSWLLLIGGHRLAHCVRLGRV